MGFWRPSVDCISESRPLRRASRPRLAAWAPAVMALAVLASAAMSDAEADSAAIRIGAPLPLTGALSPEGIKLQQGYELWKDVVNAGGGIEVAGAKHPIEIVYYDYQSATPKAVQLAEKL